MLAAENKKLQQAGFYRLEVVHADGVRDFTRRDYLGFAKDERILEAARAALADQGLGGLGAGGSRMFSGTRMVHKQLEEQLSRFLQVPDAVVFGSGYLANIALFETLYDSRDCLFCDALTHPSAVAGMRLSNATVFPFRNNEVEDLEDKLRRSRSARFRAVVTDGVFPFDGKVAELHAICDLAEKYDALVIVDDSLGVGVLGETGRGTRELRGVISRIDIVTGTFSKALGAAAGGYIAGRHEVIEWLRQKATPYLFSVALPPHLTAAAAKALEILESGEAPLETLRQHTTSVKSLLELNGFRVIGGDHPTLAVFAGEVGPLQRTVNGLYDRGFHVNGLCYPVVPEGQARIRIEVTAAHSNEDLSALVDAFDAAGRELRTAD